MRKFFVVLLVLCLLTGAVFAAGGRDTGGGRATTITYWQYFFQSKVELVDDLIPVFERQNPGVRVEHEHFPYEAYIQRVAASLPVGTGPEIVNLFYGWLPNYVKNGWLQALPEPDFNAAYFRDNFFPFVAESVRFDGRHYSVPTAVRSLALLWNKRMFREAGLDPERPPQTLDELVEYARRLSRVDAQGNLIQSGLSMHVAGQGHSWLRDILFRQFGVEPYSADGRRVTYNTPQGVQALTWYTNLMMGNDRVGYPGFVADDPTGFRGNLLAMVIDGSFRIGTYLPLTELEWGAAEIPSHNGIRANYASFWTNSIVQGVRGPELDASISFLKFLASPEVQGQWLERVGELPANPQYAARHANTPFVGEFLKGLEYAHATTFVDETGQRDLFIEMIGRVRLQNIPPAQALRETAEREQRMIDDFWR